jgi:hypothetical protein
MFSKLDGVVDAHHIDLDVRIPQQAEGQIQINMDVVLSRDIKEFITHRNHGSNLPPEETTVEIEPGSSGSQSPRLKKYPRGENAGPYEERIALASRSLVDLGLLSQVPAGLRKKYLQGMRHKWSLSSDSCVTDRVSLLRGASTEDNVFWRTSTNIFAFVFAGGVYGGLHLLAWNASFRTPVERLLWRISAMTITSSFGLVLIAVFALYLYPLSAGSSGPTSPSQQRGVEGSSSRFSSEHTTTSRRRESVAERTQNPEVSSNRDDRVRRTRIVREDGRLRTGSAETERSFSSSYYSYDSSYLSGSTRPQETSTRSFRRRNWFGSEGRPVINSRKRNWRRFIVSAIKNWFSSIFL